MIGQGRGFKAASALAVTAAILLSSCGAQEKQDTAAANEIDGGVVTNGYIAVKLDDGHWWGIPLYSGGSGKVYSEAVNEFRERLGSTVNVYSMVIPTSGEYYLPEEYSQYNASQKKVIDSIGAKLAGVTDIPVWDTLYAHTDEPIYLRTDYHWAPLGAYYAAECFAGKAGVPFDDIGTTERVDIAGYTGTMYSFTESANLLADPETFTYYIPSAVYKTYYYDTAYNFDGEYPFFREPTGSSYYSVFMGGRDSSIVRIETDAGTGRKLTVFKDSYGDALIPFLFGSFDEIFVCDMRYFDKNPINFIQKAGVTDLLFAASVFSDTGTNAGELAAILENTEEISNE